jgi:indole-3-glycerol phosphate synthase
VLLIVRMLEDRILHEMLDAARDAGLFVLLEAFDLPDVGRVPKRDDVQLLVGVNCRDLSSLEVRYERFARLAEHLPVGLPWVAESGMSEPQQIAEVARLGYRLALVGSALMRDEDPPGLVRRMLEAGRSACG